ncbi:MAG: ArnT family glycosyltransferase [Nitrospirota bacterium]
MAPDPIPSVPTRRPVELVWVVLACLAAFAGRLALAEPEPTFPDSFTYLATSRAMGQGHLTTTFREGINTYYPPLYPLATALLTPLVGTIERAGVMVSALAGSATIIPVWWLTRRVFGPTAAWIAVLLSATNPLLVHWSTHALTEPLFILLAVSAVAILFCATEAGSVWWLMVGGLVCGLAYLTRVAGLPLFIFLAGFVVLFYLRIGTPFRDIMTRAAALCLGFALIALPYVSYLRTQLGYWSIGGTYGSVADTLRYTGSTDPLVWEESGGTNAPPDFGAKVDQNLGDYAHAFTLANSASLLFALIAFLPWRTGAPPPRSGRVLLGAAVAAIVATPVLIGSVPYLFERVRYVSPAIPLVLILASGGVVHLAAVAARARAVIITLSVVAMISASLLFMLSVPGLRFYPAWKAAEPSRQKAVGQWMKTHLPPPLVVMARRPAVPYFADAVWHITPLTLTELFATARQQSVGYVVVDRRVDGNLRSEITAVLDATRLPAGLDLMSSYRLSDGRVAMAVYKISGSDTLPITPLNHD